MSPETLRVEVDGPVATLTLARAEKRNAVDAETITGIGSFFADPPEGVRAAVLQGEGDHFCAGLDLSQEVLRTPFGAMGHSRLWHRELEKVESGGIPLVVALHGAAIGGGMELAVTGHVRVADPTAFYSLPEGRRGIFVGGGGSVRIARLLGFDRMREMMLTGRRIPADEGQRLGLSHELVAEGEAPARAIELAREIAGNAPLANRMILTALPRIADMSATDGLWAESLAVGVSQTTADAAEGVSAFLEKRPPDFRGS
ncbi:MAG TPA: crotonase/enoyl-CoA hydratase family protein [Thermoleophilaceae bacterium]